MLTLTKDECGRIASDFIRANQRMAKDLLAAGQAIDRQRTLEVITEYTVSQLRYTNNLHCKSGEPDYMDEKATENFKKKLLAMIRFGPDQNVINSILDPDNNQTPSGELNIMTSSDTAPDCPKSTKGHRFVKHSLKYLPDGGTENVDMCSCRTLRIETYDGALNHISTRYVQDEET